MSRCISCDNILTRTELSRRDSNGDFEDLCGNCSYLVFLDVEDLFIDHHTYAHSEISEAYSEFLGVERSLKVYDSDNC